jgi:hypothetical protein
MKKAFVVPVLRAEATLGQLTLLLPPCSPACDGGVHF